MFLINAKRTCWLSITLLASNLSLACRMEARAPPRLESIFFFFFLVAPRPLLYFLCWFFKLSSREHVSFLALTTFAKLWLEFPDAWLFTNHQGCAFLCALNINFFVMKLVSLDHKMSQLTVSPLAGARVCLPVSRVLVSYRMSGWVVWCSSGVASSSSPPPTFGNCGHLPPAAKTSSRQPKPLHWYKEQRSSGERQPWAQQMYQPKYLAKRVWVLAIAGKLHTWSRAWSSIIVGYLDCTTLHVPRLWKVVNSVSHQDKKWRDFPLKRTSANRHYVFLRQKMIFAWKNN